MDDCWRKFKNNRYVFLRLALGVPLVVSGFQKLISPYPNFLVVVQSYDFLSPSGEELVARILPWMEFLPGVFLVCGLWLQRILPLVTGLFLGFILVVGQALIRKLPIHECGCFGELISFPLPLIIVFDTIILGVSVLLYIRLRQSEYWSLDRYFAQHENK